jgi:hypothetical protein
MLSPDAGEFSTDLSMIRLPEALPSLGDLLLIRLAGWT